jgi:hypothetical protein
MNSRYIPKELLQKIFEYDGRIRYRNGKYVSVLRKNDKRYQMITPLICKKIEILKMIDLRGSGFYFEFGFDADRRIGLCYDYRYTYADEFEICYYDVRNGWEQIRTYI